MKGDFAMETQRNYSPLSVSIMFLVISHAAWLWEGLITFQLAGGFVNRGFLHGFWLPLYGACSLLLLYTFGRNPQPFWKIFIGSAVICGTAEYATAMVLEKVFHQKWWDYGDSLLSVEGRICGPVVLLFGVCGYILINLLAPYLDRQIQKISLAAQKSICIFFAMLLALDFIYSLLHPNMGHGITF